MIEKLKSIFGLKKKRERKVPRGRWILVDFSERAKENVTRRPRKIIHMKGSKPIKKEPMFHREQLKKYAGEVPIVIRTTHPSLEELPYFTMFGYIPFERFIER